MKFYNVVLGSVALGIAACAAYFSVSGLARLFGGNFTQVAIMAGFLEAGKLVCASAAYRYKEIAPGWIRALLVVFTVIMMLITSLGIFGYLSASYENVASDLQTQNVQVQALQSKKASFESQVQRLEDEREILLSERQSQQQRLSTLSEQYAQRGWATDQQAVERVEGQIDELQNEISSVNSEISTKTDSVFSIEQQVIQVRTSDSDVRNKLGPLLFVSRAFGADMDTAVTWFIGFLIFVFDPMAVVLIVAFNMATGFEKPEEQPQKDVDKDTTQDESDFEKNDASEKPSRSFKSSGIKKEPDYRHRVQRMVDVASVAKDAKPEKPTPGNEDPVQPKEESDDTNVYGDEITEKDQLEEIMKDLEERDDVSDEDIDEVLRKYLGEEKDEDHTTYATEFKGEKKYKTSPSGGMRIERKD